jgi:fibronectin-binding autotransporter adhesin
VLLPPGGKGWVATRGHGMSARRRLFAAALLLATGAGLFARPAGAVDATWKPSPVDDDYTFSGNWNPSTVPDETATFGTSTITDIQILDDVGVMQWVFTPATADYTFTITPGNELLFFGAGIVTNSNGVTITNMSFLDFLIDSSAGAATIENYNAVTFQQTAGAGTATIENYGGLAFLDGSTAANATITNNVLLDFVDDSTGGDATITTEAFAETYFFDFSNGGNARFITEAGGIVDFSGTEGANGDGKITAGSIEGAGDYFLGGNELTVGSNNLSTTVDGTVNDGGCFCGGTGASIVKIGAGLLTLNGANTFTGGFTLAAGGVSVGDNAALGTGMFTVTGPGTLLVQNGITIANVTDLGADFTVSVASAATGTLSGAIGDTGGAFGLTKTGAGTLVLSAVNSYAGATIVGAGTLRTAVTGALGIDSAVTVGAGATLDFDDNAQTLGSLAGAGIVDLGTGALTAGGNNASTTFSGAIGGSGGVTKTGTGTFTITGTNAYTGGTTISVGTLQLGSGGSFIGNVTNDGTFAINRADALTFSGLVSGNGAFDQRGTGTTVFIAANTYLGGTIISAGTLQLGNGGTSGSIVGNVANDGIFAINRSDALTLSGVISGAGAFDQRGTGTTIFTAANTYLGGTAITTGTLQLGDGGTAGSLAGNVANNGTLAVDRSNTLTLSGVISGNGAFDQRGTGTTIFTAANTYLGGTAISAGTLQLGNGGTGGSLVGNVANDGTFAIDRSDAVTFSGLISGNGAFDQRGTGTTVFTAANSYLGDTTISAGTLQLGDGGTSGSIVGDVANSGTLAFNRADTVTFAGAISGGGGVEQIGPGKTILTAAHTYSGPTTVSGGTLSVNGSIVSSVTVEDGGTLSGTGSVGSVTVEHGGTYAPGNSIGTQTVNGDLTLSTGSALETEVDATGGADRLVVTGTVDLTGAVLKVLAAGGAYAPSTEYLIIDNAGASAVVGAFAGVSANFAFLRPTVAYGAGDGNDVVLTLTRDVSMGLCAVAATGNQCAVANILNNLPADNPLVEAVIGQTQAGARQAFDALAGEIHPTLLGVLADESRYVREAVLGRMAQGGAADDAVSLGPLAYWVRAFGAWADYGSDGDHAAADRSLGGFLSGVDATIGTGWRAGFATGMSQSNIGVGALSSSADVESYHLTGYAGGLLGPLALRAGGAWSWHDVDTTRHVVFPGFSETLEAGYDGDTGQLFAEAAVPMDWNGLAVEPFVGLAYVDVETAHFSEQGGAAALSAASDDEDVGYMTLGVRAGATMPFSGVVLMPRVRAAWQHAFDDIDPARALSFAGGGPAFTVGGLPIASDSALIEAALDVAVGSGILGFSYSSQLAEDLADHAVKGRAAWRF